MSNTMGYSHQQLKLIKAKYKLIEAAEQELERLVKKISQRLEIDKQNLKQLEEQEQQQSSQ